jgi:hypothetical protein
VIGLPLLIIVLVVVFVAAILVWANTRTKR